MRVRKLLCSLLGVCVCALVVAGCGQSPGSEATVGSAPTAAPGTPPDGLQQKVDMVHVPPKAPSPPVLSPEMIAASATVVDNAKPQERLAQMRTAGGGEVFFTVAPPAIKARHTAVEATASAKSPGTYPALESKTPEALFALFTMESGPIGTDNSVSRTYINTPVWMVVYHDMQVAGSGGGAAGAEAPVGAGPTRSAGATPKAGVVQNGTVTYVIDDVSGRPLMALVEG